MRDFLIRQYAHGEPIDEWFDNTRISALHGCNFWGMVRYINNKSMYEPVRELPLECGSAIHEALAIAMCTRLVRQSGGEHVELAIHRAYQIIANEDRWLARAEYAVGDRALHSYVTDGDVEGAALATLYTSQYYDDPDDKKRTIANMEVSLIYALSNIDHTPLVINGRVCVEMPIKFVIEYNDKSYVYNGRCDMAVATSHGVGILDWKTSSQLSAGWEGQWHTSHQMTGYCAGLACELNVPVHSGYVVGIQIPLARDTFKSLRDVPFVRHEHQFEAWINNVLDAIDTYERFKDHPFAATKRTDYCYRYFRMCQFADMCSAHPDDKQAFEDELVTVAWHPEDE
jgi:CRISPR/Cas system-associated exonuclease Cas4 (RecB family)